MIHVCFGLHDKTGRYSKFTGTTILSIFENTNSDVTAHILHDDTLTQENRDKFIYLAGRYGQTIKFYNVEELCSEKLAEIIRLTPLLKTSRLSVGAMYRLLTPQVIPSEIERIIYFDSDIAVNLDINELWQIDLGDKIFAAAPEAVINYVDHSLYAKKKFLIANGFVDFEDYFNSGVLLMNLNYFRRVEAEIMDGVKFCGQYPQCESLDQDILNYLFSKNYLKLPEKFDVFVNNDRQRDYNQIRKAIYHYGGGICALDMSDPFNRLWMDYFIKSPWFDSETFGRLYDGITQIYLEQKKSLRNFSAKMSGKTRAFITLENKISELVEKFSVKNDEEIIIIADGMDINKFLNKLNASRDRKIFFVMVPNFPFNILTESGFVKDRDFFNAYDFLSEPKNFPKIFYPLVSKM